MPLLRMISYFPVKWLFFVWLITHIVKLRVIRIDYYSEYVLNTKRGLTHKRHTWEERLLDWVWRRANARLLANK